MLDIRLLKKVFKNPLIAASGTFGFGENYREHFDPSLLGGVALKGLTPEARFGNEGTRLAETPSGMLNSIGLQNPGLEVFEKEIQPFLRNSLYNTVIIANINGSTLDDYKLLAEASHRWENIDMIELNISCPNVKEGGMAFGIDPQSAAKTVKAVREHIKKPLIVKLSPSAPDIGEIAKAVEGEGADALSLINTVPGMAIDVNTRRPVLGNTFGGLSGPAVKPIALRMVWQARSASKLPIIGGGGIFTAEDALEFLMAGANALSIGTVFFNNPLAALEILDGLKEFCIKEGLDNIGQIVGAARPRGKK